MKGGVIMDVTNAEEAKIAENAGACAVMALEHVPSDILKMGGVARMVSTCVIDEIRKAVSIPVMAKVRIGHTVEAQILEQAKVDFIDESEVLTRADEIYIKKEKFKTPFVCGCYSLNDALQRIDEGAVMIRSKGEAGTGNIFSAVNQFRRLKKEIKKLQQKDDEAFEEHVRTYNFSRDLAWETRKTGKLPAVLFAAGGIATPADAALMMQLGAEGVFVGSVNKR